MTALLPAEITSRRVVARYLNLVADGPEDPDALPDGAVPTGDVRFTRVTDGRVWADTTQSDGTTVRIAKGPIVAKIDPATGEIGLAHDPAHGVNLPVGLWSVEERVAGRPAKPWVLDVTAGEGVIDLHVQAPVVPTPTTVLVPSLETMERAEAAADRAETAEGLASTHAQTASEARGEAQAAQSAAEDARDEAVSAVPHIIVGAGRPDIPATLTTPGTATRVAAAPSGTVFRSTDGPQGAWEWQKQGAAWVVTQGDTGWRAMSKWDTSGAVSGFQLTESWAPVDGKAGGIFVRRTPSFTLIRVRNLERSSTANLRVWDTSDRIPAAFLGADIILLTGMPTPTQFSTLMLEPNGVLSRLGGALAGNNGAVDVDAVEPTSRAWPATLPGSPA